MLMTQGGLPQPNVLRSMLAANLREVGFRELQRGRRIAIAGLVGIVGFAGVLWLAMATQISRWWWIPALLAVFMLASALPSLLRTMRFRGPDGFVCRLRVTKLQDEVELELLQPGSLQPLATARIPDDEWRQPAGVLRRGCPEYLAHLTGLLARGYRQGTGHSLVSVLGDRSRDRLRDLALVGHLARGFRARGGRLISAVPVVPLPWASQIAIACLLAASVRGLTNTSDGFLGEILAGALGTAIFSYLSLSHFLLRLQLGDRRLFFGFERRSGRLRFHLRKFMARRPSAEVFLYPSKVLDENFDLARPDLLEEAISGLTAQAAPSATACS